MFFQSIGSLGLLKLPTPMEPHPFAAPVKLAAVCNENVANEKIIAIGKGLKSYHDRSHLEDDDRIRHVQLEALPQDVCESKADDYPAGTLICALPEGGRGVFSGDSGIFECSSALSGEHTLSYFIFHAFSVWYRRAIGTRTRWSINWSCTWH